MITLRFTDERNFWSFYPSNGVFARQLRNVGFKVDNTRAISFFYTGKKVILVHGFTKKSQKTPMKEIKKSEELKKDFEERIRK